MIAEMIVHPEFTTKSVQNALEAEEKASIATRVLTPIHDVTGLALIVQALAIEERQ